MNLVSSQVETWQPPNSSLSSFENISWNIPGVADNSASFKPKHVTPLNSGVTEKRPLFCTASETSHEYILQESSDEASSVPPKPPLQILEATQTEVIDINTDKVSEMNLNLDGIPSSQNKKIPIIAITPEDGPKLSVKYLTLGSTPEPLTDTEDLEACNDQALKIIRLGMDDVATTDVEDMQDSDENDPPERNLYKYPKTFSVDDILDPGTYEESISIKSKKNNMKKLFSSFTRSLSEPAYRNKGLKLPVSDCEELTDVEMVDSDYDFDQPYDEDHSVLLNHLMDTDNTHITEEDRLRSLTPSPSVTPEPYYSEGRVKKLTKKSVKSAPGHFLSPRSLSPHLSDFTDTEIIYSDNDDGHFDDFLSVEPIGSKKIKNRKRNIYTNSSVYIAEIEHQAQPADYGTDTEDMLLTDREETSPIPARNILYEEPKTRSPSKHLFKHEALSLENNDGVTDVEDFYSETEEDIPHPAYVVPKVIESLEDVSHGKTQYMPHSQHFQMLPDRDNDFEIRFVDVHGYQKPMIVTPEPMLNDGLVHSLQDWATDVEDLSDDEGPSKKVPVIGRFLAVSQASNYDRLTDTEDIDYDGELGRSKTPEPEDGGDVLDEILTPVREIHLVKEDESGAPSRIILPLGDANPSGLLSPSEETGGTSEVEDVADSSDEYQPISYQYQSPDISDIDGGFIESTDVIKCAKKKNRLTVDSQHIDPSTDTEEILLSSGGNNGLRRRKTKGKSKSSLNLKVPSVTGSGLTDTEEFVLSDCDASNSLGIPSLSVSSPTVAAENLLDTDIEDMEASDDEEYEHARSLSVTPDCLSSLNNETITLFKESDKPFSKETENNFFKSMQDMKRHDFRTPEPQITAHTDTEELQESAPEEEDQKACVRNCDYNLDLEDGFSTTVHTKHTRSFIIDQNELMHVKGANFVARDANTDIEDFALSEDEALNLISVHDNEKDVCVCIQPAGDKKVCVCVTRENNELSLVWDGRNSSKETSNTKEDGVKSNAEDNSTSDTKGTSDLCGSYLAADRFSRRKFGAEEITFNHQKSCPSDSYDGSSISEDKEKRPRKQNNTDEILYEMSAQLSKVLQILKPTQDMAGMVRNSEYLNPSIDPSLFDNHDSTGFSAYNSIKCSSTDLKFDTLDEVIVNLINRVNSYYPPNSITDRVSSGRNVSSSCNEIIRFENLDDYGSHLHLTGFQPERRTSGQEELERIERAVEDMLSQVQLQEEFLERDEESLLAQDRHLRGSELSNSSCHHQSSPGTDLRLLDDLVTSSKTHFFDHSMPRCLKKYKTKVGLNHEWKKANTTLIRQSEMQENRNWTQNGIFSEMNVMRNIKINEPKLTYNLRPEDYLFRSIWYETEQRKFNEPDKLYSDSDSVASNRQQNKNLVPEYMHSSSEAIDLSLSDSSQGDDADLSSFADVNERGPGWMIGSRENLNTRQEIRRFTAFPSGFQTIPVQSNLHSMCRSNSLSSSSSLYFGGSPTAIEHHYGRYLSSENIHDTLSDLERYRNGRFQHHSNDFKSLQVEYFTPSQGIQTTNNSGYCTWYSEPDFHFDNNSFQDMSVPVTSVEISIDVKENPKSSSKKIKKKRLDGNTAILIAENFTGGNGEDLLVKTCTRNLNESHPDRELTSEVESEAFGGEKIASNIQNVVQPDPECSKPDESIQSRIMNNLSESPSASPLQNGNAQNEHKSGFCINGNIPSPDSLAHLAAESPLNAVSKKPISSSELDSLGMGEGSSIPQVEIDSLSANLIAAIENASSALSTASSKGSEPNDLLSDELMKSTEKSLEECKSLVETVIHPRKVPEDGGAKENLKSGPVFFQDQTLESLKFEKESLPDDINSSSLASLQASENTGFTDQPHSKVLSALENVCKLSESSLSCLDGKIQNAAKAASENVFVARTEEVADLEIKKIPPLHKDMVDEVLVNSFELPVDEQSKDKFIDMLIEQETAKLILSDNESADDSDESTDNNLESDSKDFITGQLTKPNTSEKSSLSSDEDNASYIIEEPTPKKNVTFKLDIKDRQDNKDEGGVEFEEISDEEDEIQDDSGGEDSTYDRIDGSKFNPVERKFERMASQTLDEAEKTNPAFDREYQRIVSQLSNEEVDECLLIWDECALAPGNDRPTKRRQAYETKNAERKEAGSHSPNQFESITDSVLSSQQDLLKDLVQDTSDFPSSVYWSFEPSPQTTPRIKKRPMSPIIHPIPKPCSVSESPLGSSYESKISCEETNQKDLQAVDRHEQLTNASTISSPPPHLSNLTSHSSDAPKSEQVLELEDPTADTRRYSVQTTKQFWEKMSSSSTSSDDFPIKTEVPVAKPEVLSKTVKPIAKQRTLSITSSVSVDNSSVPVDGNTTNTSSKFEVAGRDESSAKPLQPSAGVPSTDNFVNVATTIAESFKESRNSKSIDSETEYIGSHPSEYFAYENPALKIDATDLSSRFLMEKESGIFDKRYSECLNEIPPITIPRKTIYERSASLPSSELSDESVRTRKRMFESQIKKEMVVDQLMTQLEEESSLEYKTISDTERKITEVTQEDMINRQIHTDIFCSEINEQIDDSAQEHKQIGLDNIANEVKASETNGATRDKVIKAVSSEVIDEIISESVNQVSHLSIHDKINSSADLPEPSMGPLTSNPEAWSKDPSEIHIDKSELESTEKEVDKEGSDYGTRGQFPDKEPVPSITYSLSGKQRTDSYSPDQSVDTQSESDVTPADSKDKQIWDTIEYDVATTTLIDKQVVCTPEEHVPDTVWEVPIQENEQEVYDQGVPIEAQEQFESGLTEKSIESTNDNEKVIRTMAEGVIADIESVLSGKNIDFLSSDAAQTKLSEFLESMHESGVDKSVGKDLIESVLAKKHRENMQKMFRTDTNTSSVEITDEDLRSTGVETDLSLQDCRIQGPLESRRKSSYDDLSADVFEKSPEDVASDKLFSETPGNQLENIPIAELRDSVRHGEKVMPLLERQEKRKDSSELEFVSSPASGSELFEISASKKDIVPSIDNIELKIASTKTSDCEKISSELTANVEKLPQVKSIPQTTTADIANESTKVIVEASEILGCLTEISNSSSQLQGKGKEPSSDPPGLCDLQKKEVSRIETRKNNIEVGEAVFLDSSPESTTAVGEQPEKTKCSVSESSLPEEIDEPISESSGADDHQVVALSDPSKKLLKKRSKDIKKTTTRRSGADVDVHSSSSESCYQSCEQTDTKTPSRPLSSDVEALLAGAAGTACSSEYESAVSREISSRSNIGTSSHDYHTAVSSLSSRDSMKSLSSESSGNLASVEISSEASETLMASTLELDKDDVMSATTIDEDEFKSQQIFEPYETDIPPHVICGESSPFRTRKQDTYDDEYDSEGTRYQGVSQRMKRSHEMTFQPEPHAIIPENSMHDSTSQAAALLSSTDDPIGSFASSSSDMISSRGTIIEVQSAAIEKKSSTAPSSEQWSLNISGSSDQFSFSSESKEECVTTPATVGTVTNEAIEPQACSSVTILSSVVSENGIESVGTQITSRHSASPQPEIRSKIPQPSRVSTSFEDDTDNNVGKKVGHRRNESTSISQSKIPVAIRGETQLGTKFAEGLEDVAESDRYPEDDRKCISGLDQRELEDRYEESLHTEADQGLYRDIREGKLHLDDRFPSEDDSRELERRTHSQISKSDSESGQRLPSSTFSDDRPDSELANLLQQGSSDGACEDQIERPPSPEPPATPERSDVFDKPSESEPTDDSSMLQRDPHAYSYDADDFLDSASNALPEVQLEKKLVYEFSCSPELESCMTVARDKTPFQHNGDHEEELAEAEAAFHVVPHLIPTVPTSLPPTILEDPAAENFELEERETQMRKAALRKAERASVGSIPDITVTQHMAPLDDKEFQYPDLENEIAADSAAVSMSSKTSSETTETDQGQEYVVNDDEISCTTGETSATTEEKTAFETGCISKQGKNDTEKQSTTESPNSDSFELLEKPDLIDDFVVVEEVAKEANELDAEGKSVGIKKRVIGKVSNLKLAESDGKSIKTENADDEEDDEGRTVFKTQTKMTSMTYYGAGGLPEDLSFPLDESPSEKNSPESDSDFKDDVEDGKKWLEMQFEGVTSATGEYGYEGEFSHAPLEDIKEEDVTDLESSKVGSAGSQVSHSFGSLGSDKKSLSSTPEYDVLAGKKYFSKSNDNDNISVSSLQEFEKLEQLMAVEALKRSQGSQDSLNTWSSGSKKPHHSYDNISFTSLKEYEGLELACIEAEIIQKKAKDEEALLSQIEEGHESQASESESCETISAMKGNDSNSEDYEKRMFEIDEIIRQAQSNVEQFAERTESMGRGDSLEEVSRVPELELDKPLVSPIRSQPEIYSGKKFIQQWPDVDDEMAISTDSLDFKPPFLKTKVSDQLTSSTDSLELKSDVMSASTDSIEFQLKQKKLKQTSMTDSLEMESKVSSKVLTEVYEDGLSYDLDSEDCRYGVRSSTTDSSNTTVICRDVMGSSTDSLEPSSSAGTHATYHYENESLMSSSAGSNTLMSSAENLANSARAGVWFEDGRPYVTEKIEPLDGDEEGYTHTIHRTVEMPPQIHKVTFTGPNAEKALQDYIAKFGPGEDVSETHEVDSDGQLHIKRVVQRRVVLKPEDLQAEPDVDCDSYSKHSEERTESFPRTERQSSDDLSDFSSSIKSSVEFHHISSHRHSPSVLDTRGFTNIPYSEGEQAALESGTSGVVEAKHRKLLKYDISMDEEIEVDPREHDWRFNLDLSSHNENEESASNLPSGSSISDLKQGKTDKSS